jgi:hypothetical protein
LGIRRNFFLDGAPTFDTKNYLANLEKKKENRHEKGKIVHLSIHFLSFVNDLIFKNLEGYFRRQKERPEKKEKLEEAIGGSTERAGGPSRKRSEW